MLFIESPIAPTFQLKSQSIDIWQISLTEYPADFSSLQKDEIERANRFYFEHHRRRFKIARQRLREILSAYAHIKPEALVFGYNVHGKPFLQNAPHLEFNLTHSKAVALLAIGKNNPLGIDIEYFSPRPYIGIGNHIFSPKEADALSRTPAYNRPLAFFHLWAKKEALIKACGIGLSYPTKQFDLSPFPPTEEEIIDPELKKQWKLVSFMPEIGCCAAICFNPSVLHLNYYTFGLHS